MSQITIRELPQALDRQLRSLARANKTSLNKTVQDLLLKALGLSNDSKKKRELSDLAGSWNVEEGAEFDRSMKEFERIDEEIWD